MPVFLPLKDAVKMDHDYIPEAKCIIPTKEIDLVRKKHIGIVECSPLLTWFLTGFGIRASKP